MKPTEAAAILAIAGELSVYFDNLLLGAQTGNHEKVLDYAKAVESKAREIQEYIARRMEE